MGGPGPACLAGILQPRYAAVTPNPPPRGALQPFLQGNGTPRAKLCGAVPGVRPWGMLRTVRLLGAAVAITATVPTAQALAAVHTVPRGETLWGIAAANGMSPATIAAANGLSVDAPLPIGTNLTIPAPGTVGTTTGTTSTSSTSSTSSAGGVTVAPGDTLSDIAARNGTSVSALAAANGLDPNGILPAGRSLHIPAAGSAPVSSAAPASAPE